MRKCFGIAFLRCVIDGDTWIDRHFHKERSEKSRHLALFMFSIFRE